MYVFLEITARMPVHIIEDENGRRTGHIMMTKKKRADFLNQKVFR